MILHLRPGPGGWNRTVASLAACRSPVHRVGKQQCFGKMGAVAGDTDLPCVSVSCCETEKLDVIKNRLNELDQATISNVRFDFPNSIPPPDTTAKSTFDVERYRSHLATSILGTTLLTVPEIPSTQEFLRSSTSAWPDGTAMVADSQTAGKGRRENQWTSPEGCLMFSFVKSLQITGGLAPYLNYVVCLAIVDALQETSVQTFSDSNLKFRIKWPNDIYFDGLKIGGVLLHASWKSNKLMLHIGVGLNVFNQEPTICLADIFSLGSTRQTDGLLFSEVVLARIFNHMENLFEILERRGFGPMEDRYLKHWLHSDQSVQVKSSLEDETAAGPMSVTIKGLSPQGFLLAVSETGDMLELQPDGNSLDMMQGLIHRRI